jgi:FkbM family methyltransferase
MNYAVLNPVRNITRKLGINKFISTVFNQKYFDRLRQEYDHSKPSQIAINANGIPLTMKVTCFSEYERVMSFQKDKKIIDVILQQFMGKTDGVFWDIGANIGLYSILMANSGINIKKIVSFEPEPRCAQRIADNSILNHIQKLKVYALALADTEGVMSLNINEEFGVGNHSLVNKNVSEGQSILSVPVETGDSIVRKYNEEIPTVLKIDVEGAEIKVLYGLAQTAMHPACRAIVCEIHFAVLNSMGYDNGANQIIQILEKYGFANQSWIDASHLLAYK